MYCILQSLYRKNVLHFTSLYRKKCTALLYKVCTEKIYCISQSLYRKNVLHFTKFVQKKCTAFHKVCTEKIYCISQSLYRKNVLHFTKFVQKKYTAFHKVCTNKRNYFQDITNDVFQLCASRVSATKGCPKKKCEKKRTPT